MEQETPPISSSKQALFFLEVGRDFGHETGWQVGTGLYP